MKSQLKHVKVDSLHILFFASFAIMSLQNHTVLSYEKEI